MYRDALGIPNEGVHSFRIYNLAIVDISLSVIFAYYFSQYMNSNIYQTLFYVFLSGIVLHRFFCVNTTINMLLFGKL